VKKVNLLIFGVSSLLLLSACGKNQAVQPDKVEISSAQSTSKKEQETKQSSIKEKTTVQQLPTDTGSYDTEKGKLVAENFLAAYFNYTSENGRVKATKKYCSEDVQKYLGLKENEKDIVMRSESSFQLYQSQNQREYMALVNLDINGNKVTPQLVKLTVQDGGKTYLVSEISFPLMN
jgi:hypothetical protein